MVTHERLAVLSDSSAQQFLSPKPQQRKEIKQESREHASHEHRGVVDRRLGRQPTCICTSRRFAHLFTIICCDCFFLFSKAGERNPALWDKPPLLFLIKALVSMRKCSKWLESNEKEVYMDAALWEIKSDLRTTAQKNTEARRRLTLHIQVSPDSFLFQVITESKTLQLTCRPVVSLEELH